MKKIISLVILITISLTSCSMLIDDIIIFGMTDFDEYYMEEWEGLDNYSDIAKYIRGAITYTPDDGVSNTTGPEETILRGKGDCEDMALLFMNIAKVSMGIEMDAIVVDKGRAIVGGGIDFNHVAVRYNNIIIEAQTGAVENYPVKYSYTYQEVFK